MSRLSNLAIAMFSLLALNHAQSAEIYKQQHKDTNIFLVIVAGEIVQGDYEKFVNVTRDVPTGLVVLDSTGGNVYASIQIGRRIKSANYATFVPSKTLCVSSCALIWLAGKPRYADETSFIGFHAAYVMKQGIAKESGSGNALVGAYLNDLGLPDPAIVYVTNAPPEGIERLTKLMSERVGIPYTSLGSSNVTKTTRSDFGIKVSNTPSSVVTAFYRALSVGDGNVAASYVVPEKRGVGPFNEQNIASFFGNMRQPLRIESVTQISEDAVQVTYQYTYTSGVCNGKSTVTVKDYLGRILISKIKANC